MFAGPLAVVSDIHGNRWALEAVLRDIEHRGIQHIVNLGDSLYGPLDPAGTARILIPLNLPTVRGNEDRIIVERTGEFEHSPTLRYVRDRLDPKDLQWLRTLPKTCVAHEDFRMCHGSLERDDEYLLREVSEAGVTLRRSDVLQTKMQSLEQPVLFCGHDHIPKTVHLPDGKLIVNPGSVGLPAFTDDLPFPHALETGSPQARYCVLFRSKLGWQVEEVAVPYDWESAAIEAQKNGRPDWAVWLQTGSAGR